MAWLAGWDKRIKLDIDYTNKIGASVTWFPVTIFLKNANGDSTKVFLEVGANSRKIAITKADGTTELKGEIEGWNYDAGTPANSTGFIHTSADGWTIDANTSIWLYYDNDHADNPNIDVINTATGAAVWDGNFEAVYHMVDDTTSTILDSTSNNNDGTKTAANEPLEATGKVGQGQAFDGTNDKIDCGTGVIVDTDDVTISCILNVISGRGGVVQRKGLSPWNGFHLGAQDASYVSFEIIDTSGNNIKSNSAYVLGTLVHYVGVYDKSEKKNYIYKNGVEDDNDTNASFTQTIDSSIYDFLLGVRETTYLEGVQDEVRISLTARSAAWNKGEYNSLWDTLLTYGSEESIEVAINAIFFGANL